MSLIITRKLHRNTCINFKDGKYIAKLPWKNDQPELQNNESIARRKTQNVVDRLAKDPELSQMYSSIIKGQETKGFIERVMSIQEFITFHITLWKRNQPVRIVYDCSCCENLESPILNDCLPSTSPLFNKLTYIITRSRFWKYGISTNIEKAFLNVRLHEDKRDSTRFFWFSDPNDPDSALTTYRFKIFF